MEDWKKITDCPWEEDVVTWFWEHLDEISNDQRLRVLAFCTGMECLPLGGFQALGQQFTIEIIQCETSRLPVVHTCTFALDLPAYPSKDVLTTKLWLAINENGGQFGVL